MFKKLLSIAAVAFVAYSASAADPVVLWQADDAEGVLVDWGQPCYKMTAAEVNAAIAPGDYVNMVVSGVTEGGWPQVAIFGENGGWPPLANSGVGGQNYPYTVVMPITYDIFDTISKDGLSFSGNGAYVNEVSYTKGMEISENTVWFGDKACGWGNGVSIPSTTFENVKIGDQLKFWTSDQSYQVLLGGWSGLNLPCYAAGSFANAKYEDGVYTITMAGKYAGEAEYDVDGDTKAYDVFALLKANGVVMHGTTTITRIDYIPTDEDIAADMAADEEEVAMVKEVMEELNAMAESWPGYLVLKAEEVAAVTTTLEGWEKSVPQNIATCMETGVYEGIPANEVVTTNETVMALSADFEPMFTAAQEELMADVEAVEELAANYAELIATTESDCAGVLTLKAEDVAKVAAAIKETTNALEEAQNELLLNGVYPGIQTELVAATEGLMSLSGEIEGAYNAILEGSAEDDAAIEEISDALAELLENAEAEFKGFLTLKADDIAAAKAAVQALNDAYNTNLETALDETGVYVEVPQADVVAASEAVMSLAAEYTAANDAVLEGSEEDYEAIDEIATALADLLENAEEEFAGFLTLKADDIAAAKAAIDALNDAYNTNLETALAETGEYVEVPQADVVAASEAVMSLAGEYTAAYEAILTESLEDDENIAEAESALTELKETAENEFAVYLTLKAEEIKAVEAGIAALNEAYNTALETALVETGEYTGIPQADLVAVNEQIMALAGEMEAAYEAILVAADEDDAQIEEVADALAALLEDAEADFKGFLNLKAEDITAAKAAVQALNDAYNKAIETALAETGEYTGIPQADVVAANEAVMSLAAEYTAAYEAVLNDSLEDDEAIAEIESNLAQFEEETTESFPGYLVANAEEVDALKAQIADLNEAYNAALETALAETGVYVGPQAEIVAATEALMSLAAGVDAAVAAIEEGYEADVKIMNELAVAMQELNAMIEEEDFPGYAALKADDIAKVNKGIESLNDQINAGMEAAFETGVYEGPSQAEIVELTETVMSLGADFEPALNAILEAAQADYDYIEKLDEYMANLDEWCAEEFPGYPTYKADEIAKINEGIEALNAAYEEARATALAETGVYAGVDYDLLNEVFCEVTDYKEGIDTLLEEVDALVNEDFEQYAELADALDALKDDAQFPYFAKLKANEFEAANATLDALYAAMEEGVANFYETCEYVGPSQAEFAAATEQVMALVTEQADMLAAIENPYNEDIATLQAYMDKVKDVLDGDDYTEDSEAYVTAVEVASTVAELKELVNEEYVAALTETGAYKSPITARDIKLLDALIKIFDTTGIDSITLEAAGIKYYDLNGTNVTNPVSGKVYIRVINGKAQKVLVK